MWTFFIVSVVGVLFATGYMCAPPGLAERGLTLAFATHLRYNPQLLLAVLPIHPQAAACWLRPCRPEIRLRHPRHPCVCTGMDVWMHVIRSMPAAGTLASRASCPYGAVEACIPGVGRTRLVCTSCNASNWPVKHTTIELRGDVRCASCVWRLHSRTSAQHRFQHQPSVPRQATAGSTK